jgi:hypothetical protein
MLEPAGMPKFDDIFGPDGARAIQAFILQQARAGAVKASAKSS